MKNELVLGLATNKLRSKFRRKKKLKITLIYNHNQIKQNIHTYKRKIERQRERK